MEAEDEDKALPSGERWAEDIRDALNVEKQWRRQAERLIKRYREEDRDDIGKDDDRPSRFNILYANISVLKPSIYQVAPRPDIRRRFDPYGNDERAEALRAISDQVSAVIERAISFSVDQYGFSDEANAAVFDGLAAGRGVMRVRYEPTVITEPVTDPETGEPLIDEETGEPVMRDRLVDEAVYAEQVYWKDFVTAPHRKWTTVDKPPWIAFRHLFDNKGLKKHFGEEKAQGVKLGWTDGRDGEKKDTALGKKDRAEVWEIWDAETRRVYWLAMEDRSIIEESDDPLELEGFFPCAAPFFSIKTTDTLVPVAEYRTYSDLAYELDCITEQITILTRELKVKGLYDGSMSEVADLIKAGMGEMIPVKNFELTQGRKLADSIAFWPLNEIIQALAQLLVQREAVKQTIYEIVGISDILRGSSNPNETLGAQRIKTQFGTLRIDERRRALNAMLRDVIRLMAEIVSTRFQPETLMRMTGMELEEPVMQMLRDDTMRQFAVDVETDSTVVPDESAEQDATSKVLVAITQFIQVAAPLVQQGALTGPQAVQMLRFAIAPFRRARDLDAMLDEAERRLEQAEEQPEGPDPEQEKQEAEADKAKIEAQSEEKKMQHDELMQRFGLAKEILKLGGA